MKFLTHELTVEHTMPTIKKLRNSGFHVYELSNSEDITYNVALKFNDFIQFCKDNDINNIFARFYGYETTDYIITDSIRDIAISKCQAYKDIITDFCDEWNEELDRVFPDEYMDGCGRLICLTAYNGIRIYSEIDYNPVVDYIYEQELADYDDKDIDSTNVLIGFIENKMRDKNV